MISYLEMMIEWYVYITFAIGCKVFLHNNNKYKDFILLSFVFCLTITLFSPFLYYFEIRPKYIRTI